MTSFCGRGSVHGCKTTERSKPKQAYWEVGLPMMLICRMPYAQDAPPNQDIMPNVLTMRPLFKP